MLMQNNVLICALRVLINMLVICMLISNYLIRIGPILCYEIQWVRKVFRPLF